MNRSSEIIGAEASFEAALMEQAEVRSIYGNHDGSPDDTEMLRRGRQQAADKVAAARARLNELRAMAPEPMAATPAAIYTPPVHYAPPAPQKTAAQLADEEGFRIGQAYQADRIQRMDAAAAAPKLDDPPNLNNAYLTTNSAPHIDAEAEGLAIGRAYQEQRLRDMGLAK